MFGINWLEPETLITSFGAFALLGVCLIVFVETGLLVGFFLPGDSLLFVTGLLVATGVIPVDIWVAAGAIALSAFAGDQTGYWIGRKVGPAIFNKPESKFFSQENVSKTNSFFERHGAKAIILAHFVPVLRTFVPVAAGVGDLKYSKFLRYNIAGVLSWGIGITYLGFYLGQIEFVEKNYEYFVIAIVGISFIPVAIEILKARRK